MVAITPLARLTVKNLEFIWRREILDAVTQCTHEEMFIESYEWYAANRQAVMSATTVRHHRRGVKQGVLGLVKRIL